MSIKTELERLHEDHVEDIADGAGFYAGTNPPRKLNIAEAISGGLTTNIAKACDIFYGNEPVSQTISEAIAKGVGAGSPYKSIGDILKTIGSNDGPDDILPKIIIVNTRKRTTFLDGSSFASAAEAYQFAMAHIVNDEISASDIVIEDVAPEAYRWNQYGKSGRLYSDYIAWADQASGDCIILYADRIELP